jgi:hypothetical protein
MGRRFWVGCGWFFSKELRTIRKGEPLDNSMAQQDEGQQTRIRAGLQKLRNRMWAQNHHLLSEIDQLLLETKETSISQGDLQKLHHLSTDCNSRLSQQGLFCQSSCSYTGMGDPCPNQVPEWMRTGKDGPTEAATGLPQDSAAMYLRATQEIPKEAFLAVFGETSIIRASDPAGRQLSTLYAKIQKSPSPRKCQYTVKAPMGTPTDHFWVVPPPDKSTLLAQNPPAGLVQALSTSSTLRGQGHMAQHSCCKLDACRSSRNSHLCLIFQESGNDEEDRCLGVGIVSTRSIDQGEQIYISYSGDDDIKNTWGQIFECYCCYCQESCQTQGGEPRGSKRKRPESQQNTGVPGQTPKWAQKRPQSDKRQKSEQETLDREPLNKKHSPPAPQAIPSKRGKARRSEKHGTSSFPG